MTPEKRQKGYLILCACSFLIFAGFIASVAIDGSFHTEYPAFTLLYLITGFPILSVVYGIFAYKFTERVLLPNLLLFSSLTAFMLVFNFVSAVWESYQSGVIYPWSWEELLESLIWSGILFAISILFSVITMLIIKGWKKFKSNQQKHV